MATKLERLAERLVKSEAALRLKGDIILAVTIGGVVSIHPDALATRTGDILVDPTLSAAERDLSLLDYIKTTLNGKSIWWKQHTETLRAAGIDI